MNAKVELSGAEQNARGWYETIAQMVAALECDYDRLETLRDERADLAQDVTDTAQAVKEAAEDGDAELKALQDDAAAAVAALAERNASSRLYTMPLGIEGTERQIVESELAIYRAALAQSGGAK